MQTLRLSAKEGGSIEHAAGIIRAGGLVAFPTETVYGLGGHGLDRAAVKRMPSIKPIFPARRRRHFIPAPRKGQGSGAADSG